MKKFKGTAEEWVQGETFFSEEEEQPVYWIDIRVGDNKLAQVNGIHWGIPNDECVANVKLMLAAKDLLKALQDLLDVDELDVHSLFKVQQNAHQAINKAL
jgi:hypothetical protein